MKINSCDSMKQSWQNIGRLLAVASVALATALPAWGSCVYTLTNNWGSGFTGEINVTNTSTQTLNTWSVSWREPGATLTNHWNASISGSNPYTAAPSSWNATLAPGASATFGFQANGTAGAPQITGSLCGAAASSSVSSQRLSSIGSSLSSSNSSASVPSSFANSSSSSALVPSSSAASSSSVSATNVHLQGNAGNSQVTLSWTLSTLVDTIEIYRDTDADPAGRLRIASLSVSARSYTATGLINGTSYWFWVKYRTADGVWHNSNSINVTLASGASSSASFSSASSQNSSSDAAWNNIKKAFPGAAGFGQATTGGRGGKIYYVTSLADTNTPGTLRYAINQTGARVILFAVGGYIDLASRLDINTGDLTILGQTAPGDGITLRGNGLKIKEGVANVIIRFLRVRPGAIQDEADAIDGRYLNNIIIDHSSFSWAIDETVSIYASNNVSFQWNIISESLDDAGHVKGPHGYGGNWGGVNTSFHHNLLAHHKSRSPRIDGILDKWTADKAIPFVDGVADIRNNVIYNNMSTPPYGGEGRDFQLINNYFKPGPASVSRTKNSIAIASGLRPLYAEDRVNTLSDYQAMLDAGTLNSKFLVDGKVAKPVGRLYVGGNYLVNNPAVSADNQSGVLFDDAALAGQILQSAPFSTGNNAVETFAADIAYELVLQGAGASLKRDATDARIRAEVRTGTAPNGENGIIDTPAQVGGYPGLASGTAPTDSDQDGMPDPWETANGLDPHYAGDNWQMFADLLGNYPEVYNQYTNAEVYWYSLVKHIPGANRGSAADVAPGNDLAGLTQPPAGDTAAYVDGELSLSFDAVPVLNGSGSVKIYRSSDDVLVDAINAGPEQLVLGVNTSRLRTIKTDLIRVAGEKLAVRPHAELAYNTSYYVIVSSDLVTGATLGGKAFAGINKTHNWSFKTKASAPTANSVILDDNGSADFRSLQGALNYVTRVIGKDNAATIVIKNGSYYEPLFLREKNNLTLKGESQEGVVIHYKNNNALNPGSGGSGTAGATGGGRSLWLIESVDNLTLEKLTLKNTTLIGDGGQAEVIYFNSDQGRLAGKYISLISEQDTISLKGYSWFYKSLIAGNVDFIWGGNRVSLFEESEIRSLGDSRGTGGGGYVVQARTPGADKGYVFLNSSFTRGAGPLGHTIGNDKTVVGRTGGANTFDSIALINCKFDSHIKSNAFMGTPSVTGSATSGLRQYNSQNLAGGTLNTSGWTSFYKLSAADIATHYSTRAKIFAAYGNGVGWNPQP